MKSASANLNSHIAGEVTTLATLWRVVRRDGQQFFFTDHDSEITVGADTYQAAASYQRSATRATDDMSAGRVELRGIIDSTLITETDLRAGLFDGAIVEIFVFNWANPADGTIQLKRGRLGTVVLEEAGYTVEFADLADALDTEVGDVYAADCIHQLGDAACGVRLDPPLWTASTVMSVRQPRDAKTGNVVKPTVANGRHFKCVAVTGDATTGVSEPVWNAVIGGQTVDNNVTWEAIQALTLAGTATSVTDRRIFADTSRAEVDGWWDFGVLTWTSGANQGLSMEVQTYLSAAGDITLKLAMPFDIQIGDGYTVSAGCNKSLTHCRDKFDNVLNFGGFPHLPGEEVILRYPDAK